MVNILYKTTSKCNANCSYCFDKINQNTPIHNARMPIEDFKKMFHYICENWEGDIEWCWHGGEPLLAGYDWLEEALYFMHVETLLHKKHISHGMQTNGTLFNEKWRQLFDKYNMGYSISNDGLLNDKTRGYPEVHASNVVWSPYQLGVITPLSSHHLIENYEHIKQEPNMISYTQNWVFPMPGQTVLDIWGTEAEMDAAINRYIDFVLYYLYDQNNPIVDRNILDFIKTSLGKQPTTCIFINCFATDLICINTEGNIYKCDEVDNDDFFLGHYTEFKTYNDILNSPKLLEHIKKKEAWKTSHCKDCDLINSCSQGCWARASRESNGERPYSFMCRLSKALIPVLFNELNNLTPAQFAKLNPHVKTMLIQELYIPSYIKEEVISHEHNSI